MRKINSLFRTEYMSEEGQKLSNRDYFGYVELEDYACYVLADSLDEDQEINSAKLVVESMIRSFVERPVMGTNGIKHIIKTAHEELKNQRGQKNLKASCLFVVTDYQKIRYGYVGNSRFYLMRNDRFLIQTKDQSLAQNLLEEDKINLDQVAKHEERNNLYSYLGDQGNPKPIVSKKIRLENGDILSFLTRGVWEQCDDQALLCIQKEANEPKEILEQVEDRILEKQKKEVIDNYTLAVTFVDKVYESPEKKFSIKKFFLIALPIMILAITTFVGWYLYHRSIQKKEEMLLAYQESGEKYLQYDNYKKAIDEYEEAKKLAIDLKKKDEQKEIDQYIKVADQIVIADEAMNTGEYQKAQQLYLAARKASNEAGNIGKQYIDSQLEQTKGYMEVIDLLALGEKKEEAGHLKKALTYYKKAREKAASIYDTEGKEEALVKQAKVEETLDKEEEKKEAQKEKEAQEAEKAKQEEEEKKKEEEEKAKQEEEEKRELENQQKLNDQKNAIELENKGNELFSEEEYESAITYYQTAQAIYIRLELPELANNLNSKIKSAKAGIKAKEKKKLVEGKNTKESEE